MTRTPPSGIRKPMVGVKEIVDRAKRGDEPSNKKKPKGVIREYTEAILLALLLALFLRAFVVQAFKIPSGSMKETLQIGDHLLVNKLLYRTRPKHDLAEMFEVVPIPGNVVKARTDPVPFDYRFRFWVVERGDRSEERRVVKEWRSRGWSYL